MSRPILAMFGLGCILALTVATAWANTSALGPAFKPDKTPGAKATEKAEERGEDGKGQGKKTHYQGTITTVSDTSLTLQMADGTAVTFALTANTATKFSGGKHASRTLAAGTRVNVQAQTVAGTLTALRVQVLPGKPVKVERVGIVTAYTPGASITIEGKSGTPTTFTLTDETKILPLDRAETLAVGMRVNIISPRSYRDQLIAKGIVIQEEDDEEPEGTPTTTPTPTRTPAPTFTPIPTSTSTPAP